MLVVDKKHTLILLAATTPRLTRDYDLVNCTVVFNQTMNKLIRIYNFRTVERFKKQLKRWDIFRAYIEKGNKQKNDKRQDTYRIIDFKSIEKIGRYDIREQQIKLLDQLSEQYSMTDVRKDARQFRKTIGFIKNPTITRISRNLTDIYIDWKTETEKHHSKVYDWGINELFRKCSEQDAVNKLMTDIQKGITWLLFGTHYARPKTQFLLVSFFNFRMVTKR